MTVAMSLEFKQHCTLVFIGNKSHYCFISHTW